MQAGIITDILLEALKGAVMITGLVIIMMLLIEYLNIENRGKWFSSLRHSPFRQVLAGTLLGAVPGCVGGFAAVSLHTHSILGAGALVSAMIVSTGDEAFVLLASSPLTYLKLLLILVAVAIAFGLIISAIFKQKNKAQCPENFDIHQDEDEKMPSVFKPGSYRILKNADWKRVIIMAGIILFIIAMATGLIDDSEGAQEPSGLIFSERWIYAVFGVLAFITFLMTATAREHFIKEHIWDHIIKKHLLSVFLWTLGALILCGILVSYLDIQTWITSHGSYMPVVILSAAAIGLIPQSGPHMVFILLVTQGTLPFYVLLTSAISQQGHVSLPLLAQSKKSWILGKAFCALLGIAAGMLGYLLS